MTLLEAGTTAKGILGMLAMMAVQGTVLTLIALALVRGGRLRPAWHAAIWLVVIVKFVLPWGPAMPWSLADLIAHLRGNDPVGPVLVAPAVGPMPVAPEVSVWPSIGWLALAGLWAAGTVFVLGRAVLAHRAALRVARATPSAPHHAQALIASLAQLARVRAPRLGVGAHATGPYVIGTLRPIVVVPPALLAEPALLRAALLHELAHVRRRDAVGRMLQLVAHALFFFFPVVYFAGKRLELAREAACDAWALETGELSRPAYARLLVKMAALRAAPALALTHRRTLDLRVAAVLGPDTPRRAGLVHHLALLAFAVLALGGARSAAARGKPEVCHYTPQLAQSLYHAYPQADVDGDGVLSRDEACDLQAEVRRRAEEPVVSHMDEAAVADHQRLLSEPLCCNCSGDGISPSSGTELVSDSCQ